MNKTVGKVRVGESFIRVRIRLEEDDSPKNGAGGHYAMAQLLKTVLDNPAVMFPDGEPFDKLSLWYDGSKWIAESDTVIERKP